LAARTVNAPTTVASEFLRVAASRVVVIRGVVRAGAQGGGSSIVNWDDLVPTIPGLLVELEYQISFSVNFAGAGQVSPYAPYCAWANQLTLGGAPPWPLTELTPWYLDEITEAVNYDPAYPGLGNNSAPAGPLVDLGPSPINYSVQPGLVRTAGNYTDVFTLRCRIMLQQKRSLLYGAIPMGDPENKIRNVTQLLPLIGNNPEQNLYVNCAPGATATLAADADIKAVYHVRYIDLLPSSDTKVPLPQIGYGVQLNANSSSIQNPGQQAKYYHRDSMAYLKIMTNLINNQAPIQAYYFGLWNTQEQKSARWEYDTQQNSFGTYFSDYAKTYRRYPPLGFYVADYVSGDYPEVPSVTPYNAIMSPDANYSDAFDVAVTPAMTTAITVPPGTAMNEAYQRVYSKGLVGVAY
jgi:hypothetical protein